MKNQTKDEIIEKLRQKFNVPKEYYTYEDGIELLWDTVKEKIKPEKLYSELNYDEQQDVFVVGAILKIQQKRTI